MYVVRENKSLINAKKSFVTSMSVIKQIERKKKLKKQKDNNNKEKKKNNRKHVSKKSRS